MKKVKAMTDKKEQTTKIQTKKSHISLVKPADTSRQQDPGGGCRPTGTQ